MPKRRVTGLTDWVSRFGAIPIQRQQIDALWEEIDPILTVENMSYVVQMMDGDGNLHSPVNTSGEITEASGAAILDANQKTRNNTGYLSPRAFFEPVSSTAADSPHRLRIFNVACTEAAGSIAATTIVPALAGYTGCAHIHGVWAPLGTTDAANDWTFSVAAGTLVGPDVFTMNLTQQRFHSWTRGAAGGGEELYIRGTILAGADDNKAIQIAATDLAAVGIDYWVMGEYWYESDAMGYQAVITIVRTYTTRQLADAGIEGITSKVPANWEIRRESVDKE